MNITPAEYEALGFLPGEDETELIRAITRAKLLLDGMTGGACSAPNSLPEEKQLYLKKAICAQAEFLLENGLSQDGFYESVKIGDFSYSRSKQKDRLLISPFAVALLKLNGLYDIHSEVIG
jgi:hypothetical protein